MAASSNEEPAGLRPYIIGGIVALAVSVVGGVLVYFLTVARESKPTEDLVYQISAPASFSTTEREVRIQSVTIENRGSAPSEHVRVSIRFPGVPKIVGRDIHFSSGPVAEFKVDTTLQSGMGLTIPVLAPGEKVTISYLLEGGFIGNPAVAAKSSSSIGSMLRDPVSPGGLPQRTWMVAFTALLMITIQGYLLFLLRKLRSWPRNRNNTGFVLLHQGLTDQAIAVFEDALFAGQADAYLLGNLATATMVRGDGQDDASRLLRAAEFWARTPREKGHVEFCRALILLLSNGGITLADEALARAVRLNKDVKLYLKFSHIVEKLRQSSHECQQLFERQATSLQK